MPQSAKLLCKHAVQRRNPILAVIAACFKVCLYCQLKLSVFNVFSIPLCVFSNNYIYFVNLFVYFYIVQEPPGLLDFFNLAFAFRCLSESMKLNLSFH